MYHCFLAVSLVLAVRFNPALPFSISSKLKASDIKNDDNRNDERFVLRNLDLTDLGYPFAPVDDDDENLSEEIIPRLQDIPAVSQQDILNLLNDKGLISSLDSAGFSRDSTVVPGEESQGNIEQFPEVFKKSFPRPHSSSRDFNSKRFHVASQIRNTADQHGNGNPDYKRGNESPGLSIVAPLDTLRQSIMLSNALRRLAQNNAQIKINERILAGKG